MQLAAFALAALAAGAAPSSVDTPLAAFADYGHPDVTADNCKVESPGRTVCYLPAKTMGRYRIAVAATSTATGPDATQALAIGGPGWLCGEGGTKKGTWTGGGARTLLAQCEITVLDDSALQVIALFASPDATLDPHGPVVTFQRLPWSGVLSERDFQVGIKPPAAPAAK
jgi:hypothetical protein